MMAENEGKPGRPESTADEALARLKEGDSKAVGAICDLDSGRARILEQPARPPCATGKEKAPHFCGALTRTRWCPGEDSNLHGFTR